MDIKEFSSTVKGLISNALIVEFGDRMDTKSEFSKRKSHAYSFYVRVMNSMTDIVCDRDFAGYEVDDYHELDEPGKTLKERERLINDIKNCDNIVLFLVDKLYFR